MLMVIYDIYSAFSLDIYIYVFSLCKMYQQIFSS